MSYLQVSYLNEKEEVLKTNNDLICLNPMLRDKFLKENYDNITYIEITPQVINSHGFTYTDNLNGLISTSEHVIQHLRKTAFKEYFNPNVFFKKNPKDKFYTFRFLAHKVTASEVLCAISLYRMCYENNELGTNLLNWLQDAELIKHLKLTANELLILGCAYKYDKQKLRGETLEEKLKTWFVHQICDNGNHDIFNMKVAQGFSYLGRVLKVVKANHKLKSVVLAEGNNYGIRYTVGMGSVIDTYFTEGLYPLKKAYKSIITYNSCLLPEFIKELRIK